MGKNKGQRTKNNARPSNSSRSAELLGSSAPTFVGFSAVKDTGGYVALLPGLSITATTELSNIHSDFQLVFKKMNKKDSTTKFKALQEFGELCENSELSDVQTMLPFWPRIYCSLTTDIDHRVREATQIAHACVVKRVGKTIATYLKQLAGPWFVSQFDLYPPAASAATNCFNTTFPPQKVVSAVIHCQHEIMKYISDNICTQSAQTLTTNKSLSAEEMESKYQRLLTSSLQAYAHYLKMVPENEIEMTHDFHKKIISNGKFWKLAKHEVTLTKTSFFNVLTALITLNNNNLIEDKKKALTTAINGLEENEPALLTAIWECLLVSVSIIENWHTLISIEKLLLPKLWKTLKTGGQNCANVVYPNLLPFISQFSKFEMNKTILYSNFFENMRQGFLAKSIKFSRSETVAIVDSFVECLKYVILVNTADEELCNNLLKQQLMAALEFSIHFKENPLMRTTFFCKIANLIRYWSKNRNSKDFPVYKNLIETFWMELDMLFQKLLNFSFDEIQLTTENIINSIVEFLLCLKETTDNIKRKMRVTFSDSLETEPKSQTESKCLELLPNIDTNKNVEFSIELEDMVTKLSIMYFKKICENPQKYKVINLVKIISKHESETIFKELAKTYDENATLVEFYNKMLRNLLLTCNEDDIEALINLIFSMITFVDDVGKEIILESFKECSDKRILKIAILCALSKKYRKELVVEAWCKQDIISDTLVFIAQEILRSFEFTEVEEKILVHAFDSVDGALIVNSKSIIDVTSVLCLIVDKLTVRDKKSQNLVNLVSKLLELSWYHENVNLVAIELLRSLFDFNLRNILENNEDEAEISLVPIAEDAWKNGICKLHNKVCKEIFMQEIKLFCSIIWRYIFKTNDVLAKDGLVILVSKFLDTLVKTSKSGENFYLMFIKEYNLKNKLVASSALVIYAEIVTGHLYMPSLLQNIKFFDELNEINLQNNISFKDNLDVVLKWTLTSIRVLNSLLCNEIEIMEKESIILHIAYAITMAEIYLRHFKFARNYSAVNLLFHSIMEEFITLFSNVSKGIHELMEENLKRLCMQFGGIYLKVLKFFYKFSKKDPEYFINILISEELNVDIYLQCIQILDKSDIFERVCKNELKNVDLYKVLLAKINISKKKSCSNLEEIFNMLAEKQKVDPKYLLLDCEIHDATMENLLLSLETMSFFKKCILEIPKQLSIEQWDLIEIFLSSWNLSLNKSNYCNKSLQYQALLINMTKLFCAFQNLMYEYKDHPIAEMPPTLVDEWNNVFANDLHVDIFQIWIKYTEMFSDTQYPDISAQIPLEYVTNTLKLMRRSIFMNRDKSQQKQINLSEDQLIEFLLKQLHSPKFTLQLGAYISLNNIIKTLVERDNATMSIENFDEKTLNLHKFKNAIQITQPIVTTILMDFKICDAVSFTIQPFTDSYTYTVAYLFSWALVFYMCAKANADLRYQYAEIIKDDLFPNFLNNLFKLMPVEALQEKKNILPKLSKMFTTTPPFDSSYSWESTWIDHIVCWLYTKCLQYLPVLARQWWTTTESRVNNSVNRITTLYVSPFLCHEELLENRLKDLENMQIKIHPTTREVVALYQMDDTKLELKIILPENHPLGTVTVEPTQNAGGSAASRNSHMQLSIFLTHQNGSIWDGFRLWKANLDKKFAGVEECYICFSIFHVNTYQIPTLSCQTCRKKFHTICLYKWFNTSHKSTCPICRNVF